MDDGQLKNAIGVMKAFLEGKTIECQKNYGESRWEIVCDPAWNWDDYDYRIKSEPKEVEVYINPAGDTQWLKHQTTPERAKQFGLTLKRFREIQD